MEQILAEKINNERRSLIVNYFILLQMFNFNRDLALTFFNRYKMILNKKLVDCYFDFEKKDQSIFSKYKIKYEENASSVFDSRINGEILYVDDEKFPNRLRELKNFPVVLFCSGNVELLKRKSVSVVGTRLPSDKGIQNAKRIAKFLIVNELVIVSGLAKGIDSIAHNEAKFFDYRDLIGVIGTPIAFSYPKENLEIQDYVKNSGLLISEYAFFENTTKLSFLRRNFVMSAISDSTIVVEAGDTSGSINQARNTLKNGKSLFIPKSVFENQNNSWPRKFMDDFQKIYIFNSFEDLMIDLNRAGIL